MSTQAQYESVFATRLRGLLEEKKVTITALAKELQISRQAVSQYADGTSQPNVDKLRLIAQYFEVSADYLLGLSEYRQVANEEITAKSIGLDEGTVSMLCFFREPEDEPPNDQIFPALNALMGSRRFLDWLYEITDYQKSLQRIASQCEDAFTLEIDDLRQDARIKKFLVTDTINDILEELYPQPNWEKVYQDALRKEGANSDRSYKAMEKFLVECGYALDEIKAFLQGAEENKMTEHRGSRQKEST